MGAEIFYGAPGAIRTPDPLVRSQILYPTEQALACKGWVCAAHALPSGYLKKCRLLFNATKQFKSSKRRLGRDPTKHQGRLKSILRDLPYNFYPKNTDRGMPGKIVGQQSPMKTVCATALPTTYSTEIKRFNEYTSSLTDKIGV